MVDEKTGDKLVQIIKHAYLFEIVLWDHMTEYHFECYPYITDDRQIDTVRFATKINHNNSKGNRHLDACKDQIDDMADCVSELVKNHPDLILKKAIYTKHVNFDSNENKWVSTSHKPCELKYIYADCYDHYNEHDENEDEIPPKAICFRSSKIDKKTESKLNWIIANAYLFIIELRDGNTEYDFSCREYITIYEDTDTSYDVCQINYDMPDCAPGRLISPCGNSVPDMQKYLTELIRNHPHLILTKAEYTMKTGYRFNPVYDDWDEYDG